MSKISVLGLGGMGSALAKCLLEAGYDITVWNRTASKAEPLVEAGANLANDSGEAIRSGDIIISCISTHSDTFALISSCTGEIEGKHFIELTTGSSEEASELEKLIQDNGADCVVGAISSYPEGIGKEGTVILVAGSRQVWEDNETVLRTMAPASAYVSDNVAALAALFAALFLPRQGFMFGMIYGALVAERAGISAEKYFQQVPTTLKVAKDYAGVAAETICSGDFRNRGASLTVYEAAIRDMVSTFEQLGVPAGLPKYFYQQVQQGIEAGQGDEELPSLIKVFRDAGS